jgi:hypothetical protein
VVASVPLRTRGLVGGPVDSFEDTYECFPLAERILLRTRAVFRKPTNLRLDVRGGRSLATIARMREGAIAARQPNGKPIFYAQTSSPEKRVCSPSQIAFRTRPSSQLNNLESGAGPVADRCGAERGRDHRRDGGGCSVAKRFAGR